MAEKEIELRKLGLNINNIKNELVARQKELSNVQNMARLARQSLEQTTTKLNLAEQKVRTNERKLGLAEQKIHTKEVELGTAENKLIDNYKVTKPAALAAFRDDIRTCSDIRRIFLGIDEDDIKVLINCINSKTYNSLYVNQLSRADTETIIQQVNNLVVKIKTDGSNLVKDYLIKKNELENNKPKKLVSNEAKKHSLEDKRRDALREKLESDYLTGNIKSEYGRKFEELFLNEVNKIEI